MDHDVSPEDEDRKVDEWKLEEVDRERVLAQSDEGGVLQHTRAAARRVGDGLVAVAFQRA